MIHIDSGNFPKALEIIEKLEQFNRNLPFTYLFKGIHEFDQGNYEIAIEHFQNATKFYNTEQNKADSIKIMPNYPNLDLSIEVSENQSSEKFKKLFGSFGKHKYTVTIWQYLTSCNFKLNK